MNKVIDLTGQRFGKLVVEEFNRTYKNGRELWKCQCDCGNHIVVSKERLESGRKLNCGCGSFLSHSKRHIIDLTGEKFGKLTVMEVSYNNEKTERDGKMRWKCRCECGNIIYTLRNSLISGNTKSCGCHSRTPFSFKIGEGIETKYGHFVILSCIRKQRQNLIGSDKKYICRCKNCGEENEIYETVLEKGTGSCRACSDSRSFGERFFYWFLKHFDIDFDTEYSPNWAGREKYDFHFCKDKVDYIVEIDGAQHTTRYYYRGKSHNEILEIDKRKDNVAKNNSHFVIRINCEQSKGKYIAENIKKSELKNIFDLEKVDWNKCFYMAISSKTRTACDLWNSGHDSTKEIAEIMKINQNYVSKLLFECSGFGLCNYDSMKEMDKGRRKNEKNGKKIICTDNGMIFQSSSECSRKSEEIFGVHLNGGSITRVCRKERKKYKGFHFEFVE